MSGGGIKEALTMSKRKRLAIHFSFRLSALFAFDGFDIFGMSVACKWVSRILKMGIQYLPVDSIQTSWQSCARSQSRREAISEFVVLKTLVL